MNLFIAPETWPFGTALALIIAIAVIEGIGLMLAFSPSNFLDSLLPDIDADAGLENLLGWLHLGKVPVLVLLILFLTGYALFGYALQKVALGMLGAYLPGWIAALLATPAGVTTVRGLGALIAQIIPKDETSAVSEASLIGRVAVITNGIAKPGLAAQAKVKDVHGKQHYILVEPDIKDQTLGEGTQVLLVSKVGPFYHVIENPHPHIL